MHKVPTSYGRPRFLLDGSASADLGPHHAFTQYRETLLSPGYQWGNSVRRKSGTEVVVLIQADDEGTSGLQLGQTVAWGMKIEWYRLVNGR